MFRFSEESNYMMPAHFGGDSAIDCSSMPVTRDRRFSEWMFGKRRNDIARQLP